MATENTFLPNHLLSPLAYSAPSILRCQSKSCSFPSLSQQVHLNAPVILNGVCVRWKGHLDLERLDGAGCLEFDEEAAKIEDVILREQVEAYNRRMKEFEEYRKAQQRHIAAMMGQHHALQQAAAAAAAAQQQQQQAASSTSPCSDQVT